MFFSLDVHWPRLFSDGLPAFGLDHFQADGLIECLIERQFA